jgi:hypothetical protein
MLQEHLAAAHAGHTFTNLNLAFPAQGHISHNGPALAIEAVLPEAVVIFIAARLDKRKALASTLVICRCTVAPTPRGICENARGLLDKCFGCRLCPAQTCLEPLVAAPTAINRNLNTHCCLQRQHSKGGLFISLLMSSQGYIALKPWIDDADDPPERGCDKQQALVYYAALHGNKMKHAAFRFDFDAFLLNHRATTNLDCIVCHACESSRKRVKKYQKEPRAHRQGHSYHRSRQDCYQ